VPGDIDVQMNHEKQFASLRSDVDYLSRTVVPEIQGLRSDIARILQELGQFGEVRGSLRVLTSQQETLDKKLEKITDNWQKSELDRAHIHEQLDNQKTIFDNYKQYQCNWRKGMEDSLIEWQEKHEKSHEAETLATKEGKRRWEDRVWELLKPFVIGAMGIIVAHFAYDAINPKKAVDTELATILSKLVSQQQDFFGKKLQQIDRDKVLGEPDR